MKKVIMKCSVLFAILLFARSVLAAPTDNDQNTKSYPARGIVEGIAPNLSQVTIHNRDIPGYMAEMTMDYPVKNTNELSGISTNDEITFTLMVTDNSDWVENIHRIGKSAGSMTHTMSMPGDMLMTNSMPMTNHMSMPANMPMSMNMSGGMMPSLVKPGDLLPNYSLTTEDGNPIHLSDFRGQALAFTFFYTRCPLPDYCPRLNNNFKQTREILSADANGPTNWQFLSISFDPANDTPEVLTDYAGAYRGGDTNRWLFASAPTNVLVDAALRLGLIIMPQGDSISHNMRTVVLDPRGRVYKQFNGNLWTPRQLADAMTQAARSPN